MTSLATSSVLVGGVAAERMPRHVAIIMDGNGRWARERGLPRFAGHRAGAKTVRAVVEEVCAARIAAADAVLLFDRKLESAGR